MGDVPAQFMDDVGEGRRVADLEVPRPRQVDLALGDDAAGARAHAEDAVGEEHRLAQIVRHQDHGDALGRMEIADHAPQLLAREGVERPEGLVEHEELRLVDERAAQRGALLHAAGELPGIPVALARSRPDLVEKRSRPSPRIPPCGGGCGSGAAGRSRGAAGDSGASCATAEGSGSGTPCRRASPVRRPACRRRRRCPASGIAGRWRASSRWTCRSPTGRRWRRTRLRSP